MPGENVVGRAVYELGVPTDELNRDLDVVKRRVEGTGKAAETAFGKTAANGIKQASQATEGLTRQVGFIQRHMAEFNRQGGLSKAILGGVGVGAGLGAFNLATTAIGQVVDVVGASIRAASDQAEALSKVSVVFGDQADVIRKWSETSATAMGMSKTAALEAAGTFGNLFDALGLSADATTDLSKKAVQLASDLGSFNNVPTVEALDAIKSGLLGEAEPMRRFGAALSEARVAAYGQAQGLGELVKTGKSFKFVMTDAEKVQARFGLIMQDTANAQGDYARTSKGLANSQKTMAANVANLTAKLGELTMGPMNAFVGFLNTIVNPERAPETALSDITDAIREQTQALKDHKAAADQSDIINALDRSWVQFGARQQQIAQDIGLSGQQWIASMEDVAKMAGMSADEVIAFYKAEQAAGATTEQMGRDLLRAVTQTWGKLPGQLKVIGERTGNEWGAGFLGAVGPKADYAKIGQKTGVGFAEGIKAERSTVRAAAVELKMAFKNPISTADEIAWLQGQKTSKRLARGLRSHKRMVREAAQELYREIETNLVDRLVSAGALLEGWNVGVRPTRRQVRGRRDRADRPGNAPERLGPPAPRALGGPAMAGLPYIVGEKRPELFVPRVDGTILPRVPMLRSLPGGRAGAETPVARQRIDLTLTVRDPDGGLARAGVSAADVAGLLRQSLIATPDQAIARWRG